MHLNDYLILLVCLLIICKKISRAGVKHGISLYYLEVLISAFAAPLGEQGYHHTKPDVYIQSLGLTGRSEKLTNNR